MKNIFFIIVTLFSFFNLFCQNNIVPNPGFEIGNTPQPWNCLYNNDDDNSKFNSDVNDWKAAEHKNGKGVGHPDLLDITIPACSTCYHVSFAKAVIYPPYDNMLASNRFVALQSLSPNLNNKWFHEAIIATLNETLIPGTTYILKMKVMPMRLTEGNPGIGYRSNYLSIRFSKRGGKYWNYNYDNQKWYATIIYNTVPESLPQDPTNKNFCKWEQFETEITVPSSGCDQLNHIILYCDEGGYFIDDVELYKKCPDEMLIENKTYDGYFYDNLYQGKNALYAASNILKAGYDVGSPPTGDVIVKQYADVIYSAGQEIDLMPGFEAEFGSDFEAHIWPCNQGQKVFLDSLIVDFGYSYDNLSENDSLRFYSLAKNAVSPTYQWDFGNGYKSSDPYPLAFFERDGIYNVKLVVTDAFGKKDSITKQINFKKSYITGNVLDNIACGGNPVLIDTMVLMNNGIVVDSVTPAEVDENGYFFFDEDELSSLDTTALFTINTKNGYTLSDTTSKTISQWISESPLNLTLKNVNREWIAKYSGTDSSNNVPIAIDIFGNIYVSAFVHNLVTGMDYATIKYNPLGIEQWVRIFDNAFADRPTGIAVDTLSNVYVTGFSGTVKYDKDGNLKWAVTDDGILNAISVDKNFNVYVTGFNGTIKYDSNGNKIWQQNLNIPAENSNWASAIKTDGMGNVYLAGTAQYTSSSYTIIRKFLIAKLDADGNIIWRNTFAFPYGNNMDEAFALALDNQGSVYVTGNSGTVKYTSGGILEWFVAGNNESHHDIIIDTTGNTYISGFPLMKLSPQGNILWTNNMGGTKSGIALDAQQNIYTTGGFTLKFDPYGNILWSESFIDNQEILSGGGAILVLAPSGNVYVAGHSLYFHNNQPRMDVVTIKYSQCPDQANNLKVQHPSTTTIENAQQTKEIKVLVVPNPNNGTMQVYYNLKDQSPAFFEIYDLTGRKVFSQQLNVDSRSITISQQQLNGGVYMYSLVQNNAVIAFDKMVIIK